MKKTIFLLMVFLLVSMQVFAELDVKVTGGMEAAVTFQQINYQEIEGRELPIDNPLWVSGYGRNGRDVPRFTIGIDANFNDTVGFIGSLDIFPPWNDTRVTGMFETNPVRRPLDVNIAAMSGWFKPSSWMKINVGNFDLNNLRGELGGFGWSEYLGVAAGGTDGFFTRFEGTSAVALELINPIAAFVPDNPWLEGFYLGAMLYDIYISQPANNSGIPGGIKEAKFMFQNIQVGLGYQIPNIGHFRVQYIGAQPMANSRRITDNDNNDDNGGPRTQAAFTLTALPGLTVELGGTLSHLIVDPINRIPAIREDGSYESPMIEFRGKYLNHHRAAIGIEYDFEELIGQGLKVRTGFEFNWGGYSAPEGSGQSDLGSVAKIWLSPSFNYGAFDFGIDAGLNILGDEYWYERLNKRGGYRYGFGGFAQWNAYSNCFIRAGVFYANGEALGNDRVEPRYLDGVLTIPILFSIGF